MLQISKQAEAIKSLLQKRVIMKPPTEEREQIVFVRWLTLKKIHHWHTPNGGKRNEIEAAKFRLMGVQPGVPDIFIPIPFNGYHGLFIELKRKGKGVKKTIEQSYWVKLLNIQGYKAVFAHGAEEAIKVVEDYFTKQEKIDVV